MNEILRELMPDNWELTVYGDPICPCGIAIEQDGECPNGHKSPLLTLGII